RHRASRRRFCALARRLFALPTVSTPLAFVVQHRSRCFGFAAPAYHAPSLRRTNPRAISSAQSRQRRHFDRFSVANFFRRFPIDQGFAIRRPRPWKFRKRLRYISRGFLQRSARNPSRKRLALALERRRLGRDRAYSDRAHFCCSRSFSAARRHKPALPPRYAHRLRAVCFARTRRRFRASRRHGFFGYSSARRFCLSAVRVQTFSRLANRVSIRRTYFAVRWRRLGRSDARQTIVARLAWRNEYQVRRHDRESRTKLSGNDCDHDEGVGMGAPRLGTLFFASRRRSRIEANRKRADRFSARSLFGAGFFRAAAYRGQRLAANAAGPRRECVAGSAAARRSDSPRRLFANVDQSVASK